MGLEFAADAKTLVKTSIRVIPGQGKVVEFAIGPGAAYAHHDDFAVGLHDNRPGCRALITESSFDAAVSPKRLIKAAIGIETGKQKSRPAGRAGSHDLAIGLKGDCVQVVTDRVKRDSYLATRAEG